MDGIVTSKTDESTEHGIGLWGVKQFVEKRGGEIVVNTELGVGTNFGFTILYTTLEGGFPVQ